MFLTQDMFHKQEHGNNDHRYPGRSTDGLSGSRACLQHGLGAEANQQIDHAATEDNITDKSHYSALSLADQFHKDIRNIPLIVLYRNCENPNIQVVTTDGYQAGIEIAGLFDDMRYRQIGYMAGPFSESTPLKRLDGFRDGLTKRGLNLGPVLAAGHYQRTSGFRAMNRYLEATPSDQRIEAIFCENDILACGALEALSAQNEPIPMAVVGFDDIEFAASPSYDLTTYS